MDIELFKQITLPKCISENLQTWTELFCNETTTLKKKKQMLRETSDSMLNCIAEMSRVIQRCHMKKKESRGHPFKKVLKQLGNTKIKAAIRRRTLLKNAKNLSKILRPIIFKVKEACKNAQTVESSSAPDRDSRIAAESNAVGEQKR